ncbi:hypothetical protein GCK72_013236 [Caenorhabditis remanei]|uniref:Uncharacterized protein n=1 Tax=Caenorhabditis remanei TaxID=31234 RepID=A0A6A5GQX9_CAERE|nr:hypothetical protein GCK72_013236 [Caenorhabditis remanei]KAF1756782.1 hypothetical protein GCK72_013236 [Caenorhabditis remanei]
MLQTLASGGLFAPSTSSAGSSGGLSRSRLAWENLEKEDNTYRCTIPQGDSLVGGGAGRSIASLLSIFCARQPEIHSIFVNFEVRCEAETDLQITDNKIWDSGEAYDWKMQYLDVIADFKLLSTPYETSILWQGVQPSGPHLLLSMALRTDIRILEPRTHHIHSPQSSALLELVRVVETMIPVLLRIWKTGATVPCNEVYNLVFPHMKPSNFEIVPW